MPIKEGIEYGVNEALTNLRSKPISATPDLPLATRINLLKDKDPKRYQENMQRLIQAENDGNEEARKLLGEIGEDASRNRRGYEGLKDFVTAVPFGLSSLNSFLGSKFGSQFGDKYEFIGGLIGGLAAAPHDVMNISDDLYKNIKYAIPNRVDNRNVYFYNNISPAGYKFKDHRHEIIPLIKDFILDNHNVNRKWELPDGITHYVKTKNATSESVKELADIGRDEAYRRYLVIKSERPVFIENNNGTVSYNLDYLKSILKSSNGKAPDFDIAPITVGKEGKFDFITGAFGGIDSKAGAVWYENGVLKLPFTKFRYLTKKELNDYSDEVSKFMKGYTAESGIEKIGSFHMRNTWDLQPFKEQKRNFIGKFGKLLPKSIKDLEVSNIMGGSPFTLDMHIPYSIKAYKGTFRGTPLKTKYSKDFKESMF